MLLQLMLIAFRSFFQPAYVVVTCFIQQLMLALFLQVMPLLLLLLKNSCHVSVDEDVMLRHKD